MQPTPNIPTLIDLLGDHDAEIRSAHRGEYAVVEQLNATHRPPVHGSLMIVARCDGPCPNRHMKDPIARNRWVEPWAPGLLGALTVESS
ncbi:MAG: hypothetical protein IID37_02735 [Planctomycetes bacterium]|nr:hypothetical protein [Planctomycetota bacterium]